MARLGIGFVEWPDGLTADDARWEAIEAEVARSQPDVLVTNELPFGPWIAEGAAFTDAAADASIAAHEAGLDRLARLNVTTVISSRPVREGCRLVNEAIAIERGVVRALHRKQMFPDEPGWFESRWYVADRSGFAVADIQGIKVGVLLCTEAMFNERARAYGRDGAALIVIPRATGSSLEPWKIAGAMAALVSGAYVVSSNRAGGAFGGHGFGWAPGGRLLGETSETDPLIVLQLDTAVTEAAQRSYPCYVPDDTLC